MIESLVVPRQNAKAKDRRVWSIPLEGVWLPFFLATNTEGKTDVPSEALGAPLRLAKASDGTVKFSKTGRPIFRVTADLSNQIKIVRENFVAQLQAYANTVVSRKPEEYKAEVAKAQKAARPILEADAMDLEKAIAELKAKELAEAMAKATGKKPEAEEPKTKKPKTKEPKAKEPKAEEPKAEEPKAEEKAEDSTSPAG